MVGVRKVALDIENFKPLPILQDLLTHYKVVEISGDGSNEHIKAGLSRGKVLLKAYGKRHET